MSRIIVCPLSHIDDVIRLEQASHLLTLLGPARAHAVILRVLEKPYYYGKAAAVADVWHDEAVVEAVLARFERPDAYVDAELLGYNGPQVVPALARHAGRFTDQERLPDARDHSLAEIAWLARHEQDESLARAHATPFTRVERGAGLALIGGGWLAAIGGFVVGPFAVLAGIVLLLVSFIRVRLTRSDPYDQIDR